MEEWRLQDPLFILRNDIGEKIALQIEKKVQNSIENAFSKAANAPPPNPKNVLYHVAN